VRPPYDTQALLQKKRDGIALTKNNRTAWAEIYGYILECNHVFRRHNVKLNGRYLNQRRLTSRTHPDCHIVGTAFTTGAINLWNEGQDGRSRAHQDSGDLPEGFGVICVIRTGHYQGGYLIFPAYRIAFDLHTTDVLLYDPHEMHGNSPIVGDDGWQRLSTIWFYRERMRHYPRH
jgi:hypothetical protein